MMDLFLYLRQNRRIGEAQKTAHSAENQAVNLEFKLRDMEKEADVLALVNQALFEIVAEKLGVSEEDVLQKIEEIDMRDGVKDGKLGSSPSALCPKCNRNYNVKLNKCLYCGFVNEEVENLLIDKYVQK